MSPSSIRRRFIGWASSDPIFSSGQTLPKLCRRFAHALNMHFNSRTANTKEKQNLKLRVKKLGKMKFIPQHEYLTYFEQSNFPFLLKWL